MYLLAVCRSFLEKSLFRSSAYFLIGFFGFFAIELRGLYYFLTTLRNQSDSFNRIFIRSRTN